MYKTNVEEVVKNFTSECFRFWMKETDGDKAEAGLKAGDDVMRITGNPNLPNGGSDEFKNELAMLKQDARRFIGLMIQGIETELHKLDK